MNLYDPKNLTLDELAKILEAIPSVRTWLDTVEEHALTLAQNGIEVPGYELGIGRSMRVWPDSEDIPALIHLYGLDEDTFNPRVPLSVAQMEKVLGKKDFSEKFGNHVGYTEGKPKLVRKKQNV